MHFAFVLYRYFPHGGLQKDFLRTLHEAVARGHKVTAFFAVQEGDLPENDLFNIVKVPVKGWSNHAKMASFAENVKVLVSQKKYDRILMFSRIPGGDFYFAADNCLAADWGRLHSKLTLKLLPRYRTFLKLERGVFAPESSTHILALTHKQLADYQKFYRTQPERFSVMPAGIDEKCRRPENANFIREYIRKKYNIPQDALLLIQVAAQFGVKGVDRSIAALAHLLDKTEHDCRLLVAGGGEIEKYRKIAENQGVGDKVVFAGACCNIGEMIAAADLMIHPARKEATGTVIVESLAVGVPVIASGTCGYADYTAELSPQLVTPEPFEQTDLNNALLYALDSLPEQTSKAMQMVNNSSFYRRAGVMIDHLEGVL
ncbi:MAG: glycosyltransferase family 4 protein [Lentisphaeria bacterium]|nr:glycosyltransferase family 4 protein [Lentisphaeria bacterium]